MWHKDFWEYRFPPVRLNAHEGQLDTGISVPFLLHTEHKIVNLGLREENKGGLVEELDGGGHRPGVNACCCRGLLGVAVAVEDGVKVSFAGEDRVKVAALFNLLILPLVRSGEGCKKREYGGDAWNSSGGCFSKSWASSWTEPRGFQHECHMSSVWLLGDVFKTVHGSVMWNNLFWYTHVSSRIGLGRSTAWRPQPLRRTRELGGQPQRRRRSGRFKKL